jgi:hypothetical protein
MAGRKTMISLHAGEVLSRILYPTNSLATKAYFINLLQEYLLAILYYDYQKLKPNYYVKHHETITFMSNFKHESGQSRSIEDITHSCPIQKSEPAQKDVSSNHLLSATSKNHNTQGQAAPENASCLQDGLKRVALVKPHPTLAGAPNSCLQTPLRGRREGSSAT